MWLKLGFLQFWDSLFGITDFQIIQNQYPLLHCKETSNTGILSSYCLYFTHFSNKKIYWNESVIYRGLLLGKLGKYLDFRGKGLELWQASDMEKRSVISLFSGCEKKIKVDRY